MKKTLFFLLLTLLGIPLSISAQTELRFEYGCNFKSDKMKGSYTLFNPSKEAGKVVDTILRVMAIKNRPFQLQAANVETAQATMRGDERYLLYSNEFLKKLATDTRTRWSAYAVFAHEIGHHHSLHNLKDTSTTNRRRFELEADDFAARILARMGASREDALAAVNGLTDDNSPNYPEKSARLEQMGIAYDEEKEAVDKVTQDAQAANKTSIAIDPKSFNRWCIVKKENVNATIDEDKVVIELNNISAQFRERTLWVKIASNDGNLRVTKVEGTGQSLKYEANMKIVWRYRADGMTKSIASSAEKIRISVYAMNNLPQKAEGLGMSIGMTVVGAGCLAVGLIDRNKALADYKIYKTLTDENDAAYTTVKRNDFYANANAKYIKSQVLMAGSIVGILGAAWCINKIKINRQAEEAGFALIPEKKRWTIEPIVSNTGGIGIGIKF
jgi:hypothetical protein